MIDSRPRGRGFEPQRRHCVVSLSKNINHRLVLVQPRKTRPFITERLLMGRKESNQTKQTKLIGKIKGRNSVNLVNPIDNLLDAPVHIFQSGRVGAAYTLASEGSGTNEG